MDGDHEAHLGLLVTCTDLFVRTLLACMERAFDVVDSPTQASTDGVMSTMWPRYFERRARGDMIGAGRSNPAPLLLIVVFLASPISLTTAFATLSIANTHLTIMELR